MYGFVRRVLCRLVHLYFEISAKYKYNKGEILMFHNVGGEGGEFDVSIDALCELLERLKGKNIIRLEDWENENKFIALTIDDVPETFYKNAFPLFVSYGCPFTIFVSMSLLNTPGYITTAQLKEMSESPFCTVGSHGVNHAFFTEMKEDEALADLEKSKSQLESLIGKKVELYAFPYGSYYACGFKNKHLVAKVYKYGFGTVACPITNPMLLSKYFLPRINVSEKFLRKLK